MAFGALVRRYQELAFRAAFLITRDAGEAEEACQEAFVKAHRSLARFRRDDPFRPWLLKIVTNQAKNRLRSAGRRHGLALRAGALDHQPDPGPDERAIADEGRRTLLAAIEQLSEKDREIIAYRYFLDLSVSETAGSLGIAMGTAKSRLSRALERLETVLSLPSPGGHSS